MLSVAPTKQLRPCSTVTELLQVSTRCSDPKKLCCAPRPSDAPADPGEGPGFGCCLGTSCCQAKCQHPTPHCNLSCAILQTCFSIGQAGPRKHTLAVTRFVSRLLVKRNPQQAPATVQHTRDQVPTKHTWLAKQRIRQRAACIDLCNVVC